MSENRKGPTHKEWRDWLETDENTKYVRYTQRLVLESMRRAEWDLDGEEFRKALYSNIEQSNADTGYFGGKFQRMKDHGLVCALAALDGMNSAGWYEWQMHYMYHFGLSNMAYFRFGDEDHKEWLKKRNLESQK